MDPQVLHFMQVPLAARKSQVGLETSIRTARRVECRTSLIDRFWREADIHKTAKSAKCHLRTHAPQQSVLYSITSSARASIVGEW